MVFLNQGIFTCHCYRVFYPNNFSQKKSSPKILQKIPPKKLSKQIPKKFPQKFQTISQKIPNIQNPLMKKMENWWNDINDNISNLVEFLPLKKKCVNKE